MSTIDGTKVDETDEERRIRLNLRPLVEPVADVPDNDAVIYKHDPSAGKVVAKARPKPAAMKPTSVAKPTLATAAAKEVEQRRK